MTHHYNEGHHCGPSAAIKSFARATWGYFSAVCFVYGRALLRETGRPQGMVESCWGGSAVETWSSAEMLERCPSSGASSSSVSVGGGGVSNGDFERTEDPEDYALHPPYSNGNNALAQAGSANYLGMINPLLKSPVKGAIWYQGEANAGRYNLYDCQMRAMIEGWRREWMNPPSLKNFTFVLHQLSACTYSGDVPALRWAQQVPFPIHLFFFFFFTFILTYTLTFISISSSFIFFLLFLHFFFLLLVFLSFSFSSVCAKLFKKNLICIGCSAFVVWDPKRCDECRLGLV